MAHKGRGLHVVDRDRLGAEVGGRDPGRLVPQIEPQVRPPRDVVAVPAGNEPVRLVAVLADQRKRGELDSEQAHDLVQQRAAGAGGVLRARERGGKAGDGVELTVAERDELLRLPRSRGGGEHVGALLAAEQDRERRDEGDQAGSERRPDVASDRGAVVEDDRAEDRRRDPDPGEHGRKRDVGGVDPPPLAPERGHQRRRHDQVGRGHDEKRHRVEIHGLVLGGH